MLRFVPNLRDEHAVTCRCPDCDPDLRADRRKTRRLIIACGLIVLAAFVNAGVAIWGGAS